MSDVSGDTNPFSGRTVAVLLAVGVLTFAAMFALLAWSPDLKPRDRSGDHPYSRSATGYGGLVRMLEEDGRTVSVSRREASLASGTSRLMIAALPSYLSGSRLQVEDLSGPMLIILPKWSSIAQPANPAWERDTNLLPRNRAGNALETVDPGAGVSRIADLPGLNTPFGFFSPSFEDDFQVMSVDTLEPVISAAEGTVLAKLPDRDIYVLSDPDFMNNFGLARYENAAFSIALIDWLSGDRGRPIVFDATLHGFVQSGSLLKAVFDIPFLGATLVGFAGFLLLGWAGFVRNRPPRREEREIALGKQALAENSAALFAMTRREARLAPGYLMLARRALIRTLGLPRSISERELSDTLERIGKQAETDTDWKTIEAGLSKPVSNREELRNRAQTLWRWRKEVTHGH